MAGDESLKELCSKFIPILRAERHGLNGFAGWNSSTGEHAILLGILEALRDQDPIRAESQLKYLFANTPDSE
jgi:hypothetical protein